MRKVKKVGVSMFEMQGYMFISERVRNDVNGNPRYNVMVFQDGYFIHSYNTHAYDGLSAMKKFAKLNGIKIP